jgi:hypothetical protein
MQIDAIEGVWERSSSRNEEQVFHGVVLNTSVRVQSRKTVSRKSKNDCAMRCDD